jgi:soluble lytic murein transglycosylase-like protein
MACNNLQIRPDRKPEPKPKIYVVDNDIFTKEEIQATINKAYMIETGSKMNDKNIQTYVDVLYFASNYFKLDYKDIIAIITIESEWNPMAYGKNWNGTEDIGLCQINTIHLNNDYYISKQICLKYNIKHTNSLYDISLNILSAFIYMNDMRMKMISENRYYYRRYITSYNCGFNGSVSKNYRTSAEKYWNRFIKIRSRI